MAAEVNDTDHHAHPEGVTMECPVSCVGVRTVADLVNLLTTVTRAALPDPHPSIGPDLDEPWEHDEHSRRCPVSCLNLSTRVTNALRYDCAKPQT